MIITGTIVVTITVIVSAITGTAGVAGGFYWGSTKEDRKNKKALQKLKEEQHVRQRELHQSTHSLITNTDSQVMTVTNNTAGIQKKISTTTAHLETEINVMQETNLQLLSVTDLIKLTGESVSQDLQPLIKELQRRIDELIRINLELTTTKIYLIDTVQKLQGTVDKHIAIQDKLEVDVAGSNTKIEDLTRKLNDAASLMLDSIDIKDKKIISLEAKSAELASKLSTAIKMNQTLRAENKAFTQIIDSLTKALEVHQSQEKQIEPVSNSPKLRLFGT